MVQHSYNILGNITIVNFSDKYKEFKKRFAREILKKNKISSSIKQYNISLYS